MLGILRRAHQHRPLDEIAPWRKAVLLIIFCLAQYIDAFGNSALLAAVPVISTQLNIADGTSVWLISGYQLTFAALLLSSGRLSDLYSPKLVFIAGSALLSFTALGAGFVRAEVPLIVLRAFMGIGAAMNIPSALHIIVHMFPESETQSRALAAFGAAAATGNVTGLIIGAALVTYASWPWVFYFMTIVAFTMAVCIFVLVPSAANGNDPGNRFTRLERLDLIGVFSMTAALILFVFAVTSGSVNGWRQAEVIAPIIIFGVLVVFFFIWEARIPKEVAAVPPKMWKYENFTILTIISLQPFMWWASVQFTFSWYYQEVFHWSTIMTAVHFLPLGVVSFFMMGVSSALQQKFPLKWVILTGEITVLIGTVLLPFADTKERYWHFVFPGFIIGTAGMTVVFVTANIAMFAVTPPEVAAMVGAIFNSAVQLGSAAGTAIVTSIQATVQSSHGGASQFNGRAAGLWFLFAVNAVATVGVLVFMHNVVPPIKQTQEAIMMEPREKDTDGDNSKGEEKHPVTDSNISDAERLP